MDKIKRKGAVVVVLDTPNGKKRLKTHNIVTTAGDIFYAQMGAGEVVTNNFAQLELGSSAVPDPQKNSNTSSITTIGSTEKALSVGYPKTDCDDADNGEGGVNIVTYKYVYAKADFQAVSVTEGIIKVAAAGAGQPVLCHFEFNDPFPKTPNDTLTVFANHECEGV